MATLVTLRQGASPQDRLAPSPKGSTSSSSSSGHGNREIGGSVDYDSGSAMSQPLAAVEQVRGRNWECLCGRKKMECV